MATSESSRELRPKRTLEGEAVEACPWCGDALVLFVDPGWQEHAVSCGRCGGEGPGGVTRAAAIQAWNARK